jgi:hypothetical protein
MCAHLVDKSKKNSALKMRQELRWIMYISRFDFFIAATSFRIFNAGYLLFTFPDVGTSGYLLPCRIRGYKRFRDKFLIGIETAASCSVIKLILVYIER